MKTRRSKYLLIFSCILFVIAGMGVNTYRMGKQINYLQADNSDKDQQIVTLERELENALASATYCKNCGDRGGRSVKNAKSQKKEEDYDFTDDEPVVIIGDENKDNDLAFSRLEQMNKFEEEMQEAERKSLQEEYDYE